MMAVCMICGDGPTVRSHLFPRSFGHMIRNGASDVLIGSLREAGKRISKGAPFDEHILCAEHDGLIGKFDKFAVEFCRGFDAAERKEDGNAFIRHDVRPDFWWLLRRVLYFVMRCHRGLRPTRLI